MLLQLSVVFIGWTVHPMGLDGLITGKLQVAGENLEACVTHQLLKGADVGPVPQHIDGKSVAKSVGMDVNSHALGDPLTDMVECIHRQRVAVTGEKEVAFPFKRWRWPARVQIAGEILLTACAEPDITPLAPFGVVDAHLAVL